MVPGFRTGGRRRLRDWPLLHLVALAGALAALSCTDPTPDRDVLNVGLIAPLTGNPAVRDGAQLAADEINAGGGIAVAGRSFRIRLIVEDSEEGPQAAVSKALKLINRDRVAVLVGLPRSYNAIPVARLADQHRVPLISIMSTHPETTAGKHYAFRMAFLDTFQGQVLAEFAFAELQARRAAALVDAASAYSTHLGDVFGREFRDLGGELVAYETFTEDHSDVTEQLERIAGSDADVLFLPNFSPLVLKHARAARGSGITATLLGGDTWGNGIDDGDWPEIRGSYFSDFWAPGIADDTHRAFVAAYRRKLGEAPTASAALSYDAIGLIAEAIRHRGNADAESIRAGLAGIEDFHGVTGTIGFHGSGDPSRSVFIRRVEDDGQIRLQQEVEP